LTSSFQNTQLHSYKNIVATYHVSWTFSARSAPSSTKRTQTWRGCGGHSITFLSKLPFQHSFIRKSKFRRLWLKLYCTQCHPYLLPLTVYLEERAGVAWEPPSKKTHFLYPLTKEIKCFSFLPIIFSLLLLLYCPPVSLKARNCFYNIQLSYSRWLLTSLLINIIKYCAQRRSQTNLFRPI
jgi:hypothetical protein